MYAIATIAGTQVKVQQGDKVCVPKLDLEVGQSTQINDISLVSTDDEILIGEPTLSNASIQAKVLSHGREKKIIVFKMKRRKKYRRKRGHRQLFTELLIENLSIA
ncbi:MAG: 50S ribosomal protein L21 [Candidatus Latescibacteria bacterium]|nr:50S ribosomal protein L21 [Candidatus Latescibacterota bacterium]MCK5328776.1 50S ribosomal protein L21 [Candidatus Latescibacterota bacterium]MCK5381803.1 50S ribosomal protein L21 [Candidatus Latescibacterota bacterium]MCK5527721.1 50S ribosomal protein L21 [Candidatus Latescibacterota bacterium]MCK5734127.1 50S ribosomal protein L21 [Candidatus Latescibacterota bacterium]